MPESRRMTEENHENLSHVIQSPGRGLNQRPSKYEAEELLNRDLRYVVVNYRVPDLSFQNLGSPYPAAYPFCIQWYLRI
jgi:hypothetical protein